MANGDASPVGARPETENGESRGPTDIIPVSGDETTVAVRVPSAADAEEGAAIATAIGAHLRDRAVAAASEAEPDAPPAADAWKLTGRLRGVGRDHWPDDVREGDEWQAAARSFY